MLSLCTFRSSCELLALVKKYAFMRVSTNLQIRGPLKRTRALWIMLATPRTSFVLMLTSHTVGLVQICKR